jgi:uncharacterized protein with FMN-binding domain
MKAETGKRRKFKVWLIVLSSILGVLVVGSGIAFLAFEPGRREAMNVVVDNVSFQGLRDGTYVGEYVGTKDHLRDAKVQLTVKGGEVEAIDVVGGPLAGDKQNGEIRNGQSLQTLFGRVIENKSLQVDTISGATITSKTHLKAVENALEQAAQ